MAERIGHNTLTNGGRNTLNKKSKIDQLDRDFERMVRNTPASSYMPTPVLDERQWEIDRLLREKLPAEKWALFVGTGLSAFFEPMEYGAGIGGNRDLVFATSALFTVATPPPLSDAILMVIEPGQPRLEAFLDKESVHWIRYAPLLSPKEFADQIQAAVVQGAQSKIGARSKINLSEFQVARALMKHTMFEYETRANVQAYVDSGISPDDARQHLAALTPRLLHEVAIHRLSPRIHAPLSEAAKHLVRTSSVDILLHARGRVNLPLLAIEVDGGVHTEPKQISKDRAKDEVMEAFGIPLFRICDTDANFWRNIESQPYASRRKISRFSKLISSVASTVCWQVQVECRDELDADSAKKACNQLEEKLSRSIYGISYIDLNDDQRKVVLNTSMGTLEFEDYDIAQRQVNFYRDRAMTEAKADSDWPIDLRAVSTLPEIVGDLVSGVSARTMLSVSGRPAVSVSTPSIRATANSLDQELLGVELAVCLIQALAEETREQIRMLTPPGRP